MFSKTNLKSTLEHIYILDKTTGLKRVCHDREQMPSKLIKKENTLNCDAKWHKYDINNSNTTKNYTNIVWIDPKMTWNVAKIKK